MQVATLQLWKTISYSCIREPYSAGDGFADALGEVAREVGGGKGHDGEEENNAEDEGVHGWNSWIDRDGRELEGVWQIIINLRQGQMPKS